MASITNLKALHEKLVTEAALRPAFQAPIINLSTEISVTATAETWLWVAADLIKRRKRLEQCVLDPKTRPNKREKRDRELTMLNNVLTAINQLLPL